MRLRYPWMNTCEQQGVTRFRRRDRSSVKTLLLWGGERVSFGIRENEGRAKGSKESARVCSLSLELESCP